MRYEDMSRDHYIAHRVRDAYPVWKNRIWLTSGLRFTQFLNTDEYARLTIKIGSIVLATEVCDECVYGEGREV